jgi:hypothetical protein
MIKMLKNEVNFYVLRNIYFAKFQSVMRYGIILWGGASETTKVLKVQTGVKMIHVHLYSRN